MRSVWSALEGEEWGDLGGILSQEVRSHRVISALWFPTKWTARGFFSLYLSVSEVRFQREQKVPGSKGTLTHETWKKQHSLTQLTRRLPISHCVAPECQKQQWRFIYGFWGDDVYFISSSVVTWKSLYKTYLNGIKTVILSPPAIPFLSFKTAERKCYIFKNFNINRKSCHHARCIFLQHYASLSILHSMLTWGQSMEERTYFPGSTKLPKAGSQTTSRKSRNDNSGVINEKLIYKDN